MTLKAYAIFREKLTGGFKNDMRNLANFRARCYKPENMHFHELYFSKGYKVLDESTEELCLMTLRSEPKKS